MSVEDSARKLSDVARAKLVVGALIRDKAKADGAVCPPVAEAQVVSSAVCPPRGLSSFSASPSVGGGGVLEEDHDSLLGRLRLQRRLRELYREDL